MQRVLNQLVAKNLKFGQQLSCVRTYKRRDTPDPDPELWWETRDYPKESHREKPLYPNEYEEEFPRGKIYDKKPFKIRLEAGKKYFFCICGHSKNEPFCDGWHKKLEGTTFVKRTPKYRPMRFSVDETKDYWLCNCKQSLNRPFCDGTHKREDIQEAIRS